MGQIQNALASWPESQVALTLSQGTPEGIGLPSRNRKLLETSFALKSRRGLISLEETKIGRGA